jgi:hypothetical protein
MSRDLTTDMLSAVTAVAVVPILLLELAFDGGTVRFWTGYGALTWGGNVFTGAGNLINVAAIKEVADNSAQGTSFTLNGIPSAALSLALGESYQGRTARLWLGALDGSGSLIADPYQIFGGRMDVMTVSDGGDTGTISLTAENRLIDLARSRERRYTPEDLAIEFPADNSLRYVAALVNAQIVWGAASSTVGGSGAPVASGNNGGQE